MTTADELVAAMRRLNSARRNVSDLANALMRENEALRAQQLRAKADAQFGYDPAWEQNAAYPRAEWRQEVASEITQRGYWDWVATKKEECAHGQI